MVGRRCPLMLRGEHGSGENMVDDYPLVREFLETEPFGPDHVGQGLTLSDPIAPTLEYFLSLRSVRGHAAKLEEIRTKPAGSPEKNDRLVQWESLLAEIDAICLLGKVLGVRILGLEEASPGTARPKATCDIVGAVKDGLKYFEVKRHSAEVKQILPDALTEMLKDLESELAFVITPELVDRDYDCTNLEEKRRRILDHVAAFERRKQKGLLRGQDRPIAFQDGVFILRFRPKPRIGPGCQYLSPVWSADLAKYLLGPGDIGRDGEPMVPMALQAVLKGADYLLCRVEGWKAWQDLIEECFEYSTHRDGATYFADDVRLGSLDGVILFTSYKDFCVINNLRARARNWLRA
jgi:hypothetical protein